MQHDAGNVETYAYRLSRVALIDSGQGKVRSDMMLLTKANRKALPALYSQEKVRNPKVPVKFFTPDSQWTWYAIEFDGSDIFFGIVQNGPTIEAGYFSLSELALARGPLGLKIERDRSWKGYVRDIVPTWGREAQGSVGDSPGSFVRFPDGMTERESDRSYAEYLEARAEGTYNRS